MKSGTAESEREERVRAAKPLWRNQTDIFTHDDVIWMEIGTAASTRGERVRAATPTSHNWTVIFTHDDVR